jgi:F-type H+-transporting ATPase subunit a
MASNPPPVQSPDDQVAVNEAAGQNPEYQAALSPVLEQQVAQEVAAAVEEPKQGFMARLTSNPRRLAAWIAVIVLLILGFFWPEVPPPHVSLSGQPILQDGPSWLTNTIVAVVIVDLIIIILALAATARMKLVPSGWQNFVEMVIEYIYGLAEQVAGKAARTYFPWVMTIFIFVIISNWSGLIPGVGSIGVYHTPEGATEEHGFRSDAQLAMADGSLILVAPEAGLAAPVAAEEGAAEFVPLYRAPSADLNVTFALALTTMFMVQVWGIRALGGSYFKKFFAWRGPNIGMKLIGAFVGILELISEFARILAFGFRLFGNIFAGEIVLATMAFLAAFLIPLPFYLLEVFVGFVQALVFTMLALVFFSMATASHGDSHEHH